MKLNIIITSDVSHLTLREKQHTDLIVEKLADPNPDKFRVVKGRTSIIDTQTITSAELGILIDDLTD